MGKNKTKIPVSVVQSKGSESEIGSLINIYKEVHSNSENKKCEINLKFLHTKIQCITELEKKNLQQFIGFIHSVQNQKWYEIKNNKGLGFKKIDKKRYKKYIHNNLFDEISKEIEFSEMRCSRPFRVHGFRVGAIRFMVLLDEKHEVCPD